MFPWVLGHCRCFWVCNRTVEKWKGVFWCGFCRPARRGSAAGCRLPCGEVTAARWKQVCMWKTGVGAEEYSSGWWAVGIAGVCSRACSCLRHSVFSEPSSQRAGEEGGCRWQLAYTGHAYRRWRWGMRVEGKLAANLDFGPALPQAARWPWAVNLSEPVCSSVFCSLGVVCLLLVFAGRGGGEI